MVTLQWHGDLPDCNLDELELTVLQDIKKSLSSLEKPSNLISHTVFLERGYTGPNIAVWGEIGDDDHFHCQYYAETEWVSLDEVEDDS